MIGKTGKLIIIRERITTETTWKICHAKNGIIQIQWVFFNKIFDIGRNMGKVAKEEEPSRFEEIEDDEE